MFFSNPSNPKRESVYTDLHVHIESLDMNSNQITNASNFQCENSALGKTARRERERKKARESGRERAREREREREMRERDEREIVRERK